MTATLAATRLPLAALHARFAPADPAALARRTVAAVARRLGLDHRRHPLLPA